jgi:hypothetical protein
MTDDTASPRLSQQAQVIQMLQDRLEEAKLGKIESILIGFTTTEGGATVQSTPMGPLMMNHLSMILQRRVWRAYDRAEQIRQASASPGTGRVPVTGKEAKIVPAAAAPGVPRNKRRAIARQIKKAAKATPPASPISNGSTPKPS